VVPAGGADAAEVTGIVHALFASDRLGDVRTDGTYTLGPLDGLGLPARAGTRTAARLTRCGAAHLLGLARGRRLLAVAAVVPEQAAAAGLVLAAARRADAAFLLAAPAAGSVTGMPGSPASMTGQPRSAAWSAAAPGDAGVLPGGRRLVASIRGMQAEGADVLLVSRHRRALAAADCGIGLDAPHGRPAWGAPILAGHDLAAAALLIDAVQVARAASRRGVTLAQAGSAIGVALAFGGTASAASGRSLLAVNGAGAIALASGAWSAAGLARRPATVPVPSPPWHAMPAEVALALLRSRSGGLSSNEARVRWHPDERQPPRLSLPRAFLAELASPLTPILFGGAALSASIGAVTDAVIVTGVGALSALMGGAQRVYTDRSMAGLYETSAVTARVLRDGGERTVPATRLVPGDIVLLSAGDVVPADCRVLDARTLQVDESSLTGESLPVDKTTAPVAASAVADRRSVLYEGTTVAAGQARVVVAETGSATQMGRSLAAMNEAAPVTGVETRLA
jgi:hypothetical protein